MVTVGYQRTWTVKVSANDNEQPCENYARGKALLGAPCIATGSKDEVCLYASVLEFEELSSTQTWLRWLLNSLHRFMLAQWGPVARLKVCWIFLLKDDVFCKWIIALLGCCI